MYENITQWLGVSGSPQDDFDGQSKSRPGNMGKLSSGMKCKKQSLPRNNRKAAALKRNLVRTVPGQYVSLSQI